MKDAEGVRGGFQAGLPASGVAGVRLPAVTRCRSGSGLFGRQRWPVTAARPRENLAGPIRPSLRFPFHPAAACGSGT